MLKQYSLRLAMSLSLIAVCVTASDAQILTRRVGEMTESTVFLEVGEAAWKAFRPLVAPVDSGGVCRSLDGAPDPLPRYIVAFPTSAAALMEVYLWVNSDGTLQKSQELRFSSPNTPWSGALAPAVRDSISRAREQQQNRTVIFLDFVSGISSVSNRAQGSPGGGVQGATAAVDSMSLLMQPGDRARRALRLCTAAQPAGDDERLR
jgi:hypothetical protein